MTSASSRMRSARSRRDCGHFAVCPSCGMAISSVISGYLLAQRQHRLRRVHIHAKCPTRNEVRVPFQNHHFDRIAQPPLEIHAAWVGFIKTKRQLLRTMPSECHAVPPIGWLSANDSVHFNFPPSLLQTSARRWQCVRLSDAQKTSSAPDLPASPCIGHPARRICALPRAQSLLHAKFRIAVRPPSG